MLLFTPSSTAISGQVPNHTALGVVLTLSFVLVVAGGVLTLLLVLRKCRQGRFVPSNTTVNAQLHW